MAKTKKTEDQPKPKSMAKGKRAGLMLNVARVLKRIKTANTDRVGGQSAIYMTATIEYIFREIIKALGDDMATAGKTRVAPHHVLRVIQNDPSLNRLFDGHSVLFGAPLKKVSDDYIIEADKKYANRLADIKKKEAADSKVNVEA